MHAAKPGQLLEYSDWKRPVAGTSLARVGTRVLIVYVGNGDVVFGEDDVVTFAGQVVD